LADGFDPGAITAGLSSSVPFVRTLGVVITELATDGGGLRAVAELLDAEALHNHLGGPHAGALFALGETASGALVLAAFADQLHRAVPMAVRVGIAYRKLARGTVTATAVLRKSPAAIVAELDQGVRPEFTVAVEIATGDGTVTAEMTVDWTLKPILTPA
jgi:acyl-coenzyme A thioesterase PaaI-like protein